jgi:hypothetical protein
MRRPPVAVFKKTDASRIGFFSPIPIFHDVERSFASQKNLLRGTTPQLRHRKRRFSLRNFIFKSLNILIKIYRQKRETGLLTKDDFA